MAKKASAQEDGFGKLDIELPDAGDRYPAKITAISKPMRAGDVFKDKAKDPERPTIQVSFEGPGGVEGRAALSAPGITPDGRVVVRNPKSNLYRFVKRYKAGPKVGMPIEVGPSTDPERVAEIVYKGLKAMVDRWTEDLRA